MAGLEGTNIGPYEVKALLGAGGMGQVYRAHDSRLEREVAVKVLSGALAQEPGYLERFLREARTVAKLNHPHIVPVYDFGQQGDLTYLVMPLISGGTLRDSLARRRILPLPEAVSITEQVASALQYAHERGLVHRDVKPANILMSDEGRALLSDFGIVRLVRKEDAAATLTLLGAFVGSPEIAAPEMILGEAIDHRIDVYALGVVLFHMLTGRPPFTGATPVSLLMMQAQQPPPLPRSINPDIPPAVEAVILKALAKNPAERYQTMAEFQTALRAALTAPSVGTYVSAPAAGTISDLPTISTGGMPPAPGSGPAALSAGGPGFGSPPVWGGPGSGPAGWAAPGSGPAGMSPGSGPAGWAAPGSGPAAPPPLPPNYATGLSVLPNQAPAPLSPSRQPDRRRVLLVLLLLVVLVLVTAGGATLALSIFNKGGATATPVVHRSPVATSTVTPRPAAPAGIITEFAVPTPQSHLYEITSGPDSALWFAEFAGNRIGRITLTGQVSEFPLLPTSNSGPVVITPGRDGALWFTEWNANQIGRITPSGQLTEFPIPTPNSVPEGITSGPDGALWFAETAGNRIGRVTVDGQFTEFPLPTPGSHPAVIVRGPDNALWFTEYGANRIGRLTPDGRLTEFSIPTPGSLPRGMAVGPDGAIWFTEASANQIGRITLDGQHFSEFPIPTPNSTPFQITAGPDGDLWFTEASANQIGRVTPDGQHFSEFPVQKPQSSPAGITSGPDGALWFNEASGNQIGRITSGK